MHSRLISHKLTRLFAVIRPWGHDISKSNRASGAVEGGADISPPKKSRVGGIIKGGGVAGVQNTGAEVGGDWAAAIAGSGRFKSRGAVGGGGDGGCGSGWGLKNFFGGRTGVGVMKIKGGGRTHHSVAAGGSAGVLSGAVVPGSARGAGGGRHGGAFGGGDEVLQHLHLLSGVVSAGVGGSGRPHHSTVAGGSVSSAGDGVGGRHCDAQKNK